MMSLKICATTLPSYMQHKKVDPNNPEKPMILIVHGAMHSPAHYGPMIALLNLEGYDVSCPPLPTCHDERFETTMTDDADCIREEIVKLVGFGREIILIMHCYGGIVGTEAVDESLARKYRAAHGLEGGVTQLVYVAALLLSIGSSMESAFSHDEEDVLYLRKEEIFKDVKSNGKVKLRNPEILFAGDITPSRRARWADLINTFYITPFKDVLSRAAYEYVPSTYIFCNQDKFIGIRGQKKMVNHAIDAGVAIRTEETTGGHNPFLSLGDELVEIIASLH